MGRIVGLEIFDDEVLTTTEPADVEKDIDKELEPGTEPADVSEDKPKKGGKKK